MKYLIILLFNPIFLHAQSEFINDSPMGMQADFTYSKNNNFAGFGGDIGFSLFSSVDLGFEYIRGSYDAKYNMESSGRMIYGAYNFKSKNNCFKLLVGYTQSSINNKSIYFSNLNVSGPLLAFIISHRIYENESIKLIPSIGLSLGFLSVSNGSIFTDYSEVENPRNLGFEFNIVSKINKGFYFIIAPSISKDLMNSENSLILGLNLGLLFSVQEQ